ncbi:MAG: hypothetical protein M3Z83_02055, partial [Actinomycetota bacterium]|nr:hypothetical protein [Actinomycetota bacterium]
MRRRFAMTTKGQDVSGPGDLVQGVRIRCRRQRQLQQPQDLPAFGHRREDSPSARISHGGVGHRSKDLDVLSAQGRLDRAAVEGDDHRLLAVIEAGRALEATQPQAGQHRIGGAMGLPHQPMPRDVCDQEEGGRGSQGCRQGVGHRLHRMK